MFVVLIVDNLYGEVQSPLQFLVELLYNQVGEGFVGAAGDKKVFQGMRKGRVSDIVQQYGCQSGFLFLCGDVNTFFCQCLQGVLHQMHGTYGMLETGVGGTRIHQVRQSQLVNVS